MSDDLVTAQVCDLARSLLMSSGAGCGKTYRMVERYRHLVSQGILVTDIVAVTFTEKAAAELKDRVRQDCREQAALGGDDAPMWQQAARQLELAPIGTIHSFCARLLRENALAARIDPRFGQLDEREQSTLLRETVRTTLLRRVHEGQATSRLLVARWGLEKAQSIIKDALGNSEELEQWLQAPPPAEIQASWEQFAAVGRQNALTEVLASSEWQQIAGDIAAIAPGDPEDKGAAKQIAFVEALPDVADESLSVGERLAALATCLAQGGSSGAKAKWKGREDDLAALKDALKRLKAVRDNEAKRLAALAIIEDEQTAALAAAICAEAAVTAAAWAEAKQAAASLDFDDLQVLARDLLRDRPEIRKRVQARYKHVLVDEFQDTNALQKEIVWYVAGGDVTAGREPYPGKLFVVGDAKQSIYLFRGADVTVFNATHGEFDEAATCGLVGLDTSRRSTPGIVNFHNQLFGCPSVMGPENSQPYEADYEQLLAWRGELHKDHDVEIMLTEAADDHGGKISVGEARRLEARALAERIAEIVEGGEEIVAEDRVAGPQTPRPARYGDFALLFRAMPDVAIYEAELRRRGVPYYTLAGRGFFNRQEIRDSLSLLRTLENASDNLALASALRSPAFAISDDTLFWMRKADGSLWQALENAVDDSLPGAEMFAADQHERLCRAQRLLADLRANKNRFSLSELVENMLARTGLAALLLTQFGGTQSAANLTKLTDLAREFEAGGEFSLREFIDYLSRLVMDEEREGLATIHAEAGDVVQLLSIHKAKGMQWPIVVVPDINRQPGGSRDGLLWSSETGPVPPIEDELGRTHSGAVATLLKEDNDRREEAEARRVLYVALTRAEDHLILSTSCTIDDDGGLKSPKRWLAWVAEALGLDPVPEDGAVLDRDGWRGVVRRPQPTEPVWAGSRALARADLSALTMALQPDQPHSPAAHADLRRAIEPIRVPPADPPRYHVTALTRYLRCPRSYWLRHVRNLPEKGEPGEWLGRMSATDRGDLAHKIMELVGRDGVVELPRALDLASFPGALRERVEERDLDELAAHIGDFLAGDMYDQWIASAVRLRTEVPFTVALDGAIIEGKIDALAEDASSALRLIDYKTGTLRKDGTDDYRLQIGLYCAAVRAATGDLPTEAALVYLDSHEVEDLGDTGELEAAALAQVHRAIEGIAQGQFPAGDGVAHDQCALAYVCKLA